MIIFLFPTFVPHACIPRERISGPSMIIISISCTRWLGTILDSSLSRVGADGTRPNLPSDIASMSRSKHFGRIPIGGFNEEQHEPQILHCLNKDNGMRCFLIPYPALIFNDPRCKTAFSSTDQPHFSHLVWVNQGPVLHCIIRVQ